MGKLVVAIYGNRNGQGMVTMNKGKNLMGFANMHAKCDIKNGSQMLTKCLVESILENFKNIFLFSTFSNS